MQRLFASESKSEPKDVLKEKKEVQYVSYKQICPGQIRYSSHNTADKVARLKKKQKAVFDLESQVWKYEHHHGTSVFSKKDALPVVQTSFGYVLIDGHHDVASSIALKAEMIPIKIEADHSNLSREEFWKLAEEKNYAYLYKKNGEKGLPPSSFADLVDDPNRYFAAIVARKYVKKHNEIESKGAEFPLWIKIGKDIPFIEFKIANALYAKNFEYDPVKMGNPPKQDIIEQARKILLEAKIEGLRILSSPIHHEQIKIDFEKNTFEIANSKVKMSL